MMILIDTNILVALMTRNDSHHRQVSRFMDEVSSEKLLVPAPVLVEVFYLLQKRAHYQVAIQATTVITTTLHMVDLLAEDYRRMTAIMTQYADARFDFADAAIMAVSERLGVTRVATLDRRDFSLFRPAHCAALELLPA